MKCPQCGCEHFYIKDPDDPYETYPVTCVDGRVALDPAVDPESAPEITEGVEVFCDRCVWHDKLNK